MGMKTRFLNCYKLSRILKKNWSGCCTSCHDDEELGYDNLYDEEPENCLETHLCCSGRNQLNEYRESRFEVKE